MLAVAFDGVKCDSRSVKLSPVDGDEPGLIEPNVWSDTASIALTRAPASPYGAAVPVAGRARVGVRAAS